MYMERGDFPSYNDEFVQVYRTVHPKAGASKEEDEMLCKSVTFCVTESCNLACTYCYECHKSNRRMSWETAKKIVDGLFKGEFVDNTAPAIILDFIGGEPLLEIDLIDRTVDYFKEKAFSLKHPWAYYYMISISTNGVLFDTPKVQEFIRKNYEHLSIGISIDGDKALHDSCRLFHDGSGSYDVVSKAAKQGSFCTRCRKNSMLLLFAAFGTTLLSCGLCNNRFPIPQSVALVDWLNCASCIEDKDMPFPVGRMQPFCRFRRNRLSLSASYILLWTESAQIVPQTG